MRSALKLAVFVGAVAAGSIQAQQPRPQGLPEKVVVPRAVAKGWDDYAMALERGDAKGASSLFADDGLAAGSAGAFSGREAIDNYYARQLAKSKVLAFEMHPAEYRALGRNAWEMGKFNQRFHDVGKAAPQSIECWYGVLWQQMRDNSWRIARMLTSCRPT